MRPRWRRRRPEPPLAGADPPRSPPQALIRTRHKPPGDQRRRLFRASLGLQAPFVLLGGTMFHFAYLPAAFVLTLGVAALVGISRAVAGQLAWPPAVAAGPLVIAVGLLAWQTHGRLDDWEFAAGLSHRLVQSAHAELGELPVGAPSLPETCQTPSTAPMYFARAFRQRSGSRTAVPISRSRPSAGRSSCA